MNNAIRNWQPKPLQILAALFILQLFVTLFTDGFALSFDEAMWHYIGRNWFRNGLVPYSGGVDNKSPLIFAIFGLSDRLFGVNYWFPRVLGTICQSIGIWYVYRIAKHQSDEHTALLAMLIYGLSLLWHTTGGKYVSYTETYEVLFTILAIYYYLAAKTARQMFASGLLAGIALAFRLTGAFGILVILISSLLKNRKYAFIFCLGVLTSIAALLLCGLITGISPHDMLTYGLLDNFNSGSATDHTLVWKWQNFSAKFLLSSMVLFYPLALSYFFIKRKADLFALWMAFEFIGICTIGIFDNVHLKEVLPPFAIMSAFCLNYLLERYKLSMNVVLLFVMLVFFPGVSEPVSNLGKALISFKSFKQHFCAPPYRIPDEGTRKKLGWWVRDNTEVNDKVFIAGFGAQAQAYSERISPTIFFNATQTAIAKARLFADLKANKPEMILVPLFPEYTQTVNADIRNFVDTLVARHYQSVGCRYSYEVFELKTSP